MIDIGLKPGDDPETWEAVRADHPSEIIPALLSGEPDATQWGWRKGLAPYTRPHHLSGEGRPSSGRRYGPPPPEYQAVGWRNGTGNPHRDGRTHAVAVLDAMAPPTTPRRPGSARGSRPGTKVSLRGSLSRPGTSTSMHQATPKSRCETSESAAAWIVSPTRSSTLSGNAYLPSVTDGSGSYRGVTPSPALRMYLSAKGKGAPTQTWWRQGGCVGRRPSGDGAQEAITRRQKTLASGGRQPLLADGETVMSVAA